MSEPNINICAKEQIDVIKTKCERIKPLVVVRCITYNHEAYIRDALDGFVMQKTDFPFVAVVHDDASTDRTAEIIKEYAEKYPDIILPIIENDNQYSKHNGSISRIIKEVSLPSSAKYLAECEGDDYWIDPLKLQKQVNFLESNPDCGMIFSKVQYLIQKTSKFGRIFGSSVENIESLLLNNTIPTPTVLIRSNLYKKYHEQYTDKGWLMGDYPLWLFVASCSNLGFINEILAVYRILENSASHSNDIEKTINFNNSYHAIRTWYNQHLEIMPQEILDENQAVLQFNNSLLHNSRKYIKIYYHKINNKNILIRIKYLICLLGLSPIFKTISRIKGRR